MLTASMRRASGCACSAAPIVLGAALAKDCSDGADLRIAARGLRDGAQQALDVEVEEADAVLGDLGAHGAQAVGLVQRVAALGIDDGLEAGLGADHDAVIDDRRRGLVLAVEAVVDALVGALDDVARLLGQRLARPCRRPWRR